MDNLECSEPMSSSFIPRNHDFVALFTNFSVTKHYVEDGATVTWGGEGNEKVGRNSSRAPESLIFNEMFLILGRWALKTIKKRCLT